MTVKMETGSLFIVEVIPGSPAEHHGLARGDRIEAVDGKHLDEMPMDGAVAEMLKGNDGSAITFSLIDRNGDRRKVRVVRRSVSEDILRRFYR